VLNTQVSFNMCKCCDTHIFIFTVGISRALAPSGSGWLVFGSCSTMCSVLESHGVVMLLFLGIVYGYEVVECKTSQ
jgi:hypothetical protein